MSKSSTCWRGEREDRFLQNTAFYKSFERDLKKLKKGRQMLGRIQGAIGEVEEAGDLQELPNMKKLSGGGGGYYRIRVGDYWIGIVLEGETVAFVRCLHRKEIYRYFS